MARSRFLDSISQEEIDQTMQKKTTTLNERELKIYRAVKAEQRKNKSNPVIVNKKSSITSIKTQELNNSSKKKEEETKQEEEQEEEITCQRHRAKWPEWIKYPSKINMKEYVRRWVLMNFDGKIRSVQVRWNEKRGFFLYSPDYNTVFPTTPKVVYIAVNFAFILQKGFTADNKYSHWK